MKPIDPRIEYAETLSSRFYTEQHYFDASLEDIFSQTWQFIADRNALFSVGENVFPITLLEKSLNEPLVLVKDKQDVICMSNICTHRGFQIVHEQKKTGRIVCGYHGRSFDLEGKAVHMPEFKEVKNYPRPCDHLIHLPVERWKRFLFTGINPKIDFEGVKEDLDSYLSFLDIDNWRHLPDIRKVYEVDANWALYCDNYLEGFHIPFVHNDLNAIIDYGSYRTHIHNHMSVQIAYGKPEDMCFDLPEGHIDFGKRVAAYYVWLFPNFMLNVYPWGVQINIVRPISVDRCTVEFDYYIGDEEKWEAFGKDSLAEKVEKEDEAIVENVQRCMRSQFYDSGRYSAKREKGVHHFHQLISEYLI